VKPALGSKKQGLPAATLVTADDSDDNEDRAEEKGSTAAVAVAAVGFGLRGVIGGRCFLRTSGCPANRQQEFIIIGNDHGRLHFVYSLTMTLKCYTFINTVPSPQYQDLVFSVLHVRDSKRQEAKLSLG